MKYTYRFINPFTLILVIIGITNIPDVAFCDKPDPCEYKEWIDVEQTYAFVGYNEKNDQLCLSTPISTHIIDKLFRVIPILLILPCAIALIVISFVIFKAIHKLIREMIERRAD